MNDAMRVSLGLILLVFQFCPFRLNAQHLLIEINDNAGIPNQENVYRITSDSLIITARSDYGRTKVNYLNRLLSKEEKSELKEFLKTFPADSLQFRYFNEYTTFNSIGSEMAPRHISLHIVYKQINLNSEATNAWVSLYDRLFNELNLMFPPEVRIKYPAESFNAFY